MVITSILLYTIIAIISTAFIISSIRKNVTAILLKKSVEQVKEISLQANAVLDSKGALQQFVEKKVSGDNIAYAVIIDNNVKAIAHSDKIKIGKVYDDDYTIDGAKNGNEKTSRFYADVQKISPMIL